MNKVCLVTVTNIDTLQRKMQGSNLWLVVDTLSHKYALHYLYYEDPIH